jgi:hypothetical protein
MVAPDKAIAVPSFVHRRPAKLTAPNDQRLVKESTLLEVLNQGRCRAVYLATTVNLPESDVVFFDVTVAIPAPVVKLDKAHAALDQAPCQKTVVGEARLPRFGS